MYHRSDTISFYPSAFPRDNQYLVLYFSNPEVFLSLLSALSVCLQWLTWAQVTDFIEATLGSPGAVGQIMHLELFDWCILNMISILQLHPSVMYSSDYLN